MSVSKGTAAAVAMAAAAAGLVLPAPGGAAATASPAGRPPVVSTAVNLSSACAGQNAEVEQATDGQRVYETWIGCTGIGFARSVDGGRHFAAPVTMPLSAQNRSWDPAIAVAPGGALYVSYMLKRGGFIYPVVAASFDHGSSFRQVSQLIPHVAHNWGDRDFIAAGPHGKIYVTWDYGPSAADVKIICSSGGSCAFANGDINGVVQASSDGGKTWGPITPLGPGFPAQGADSAPVLLERSGRVDVLYLGHQVTGPDFELHPGHLFFTSSADGGRTWSPPVEIRPEAGSVALDEWWIDGAMGIDAAGNLYATWDTQGPGTDVGWLSFSADHGHTWSPPERVTPDTGSAVHLMAVTGSRPGLAYVGWLSDSAPQGYAQYLRPFSIRGGWRSGPIQVSRQFGNTSVWPGDTIGLSMLRPGRVALSWGSAVGQPDAEIYAARVTFR